MKNFKGKAIYQPSGKAAGIDRENMPVNCVDRDYNLFT